MPFKLSTAQINQLKTLSANDATLDDAYRFLVSAAKGKAGVDQATLRFFEGAADVNQGVGNYAKFIRDYTTAQVAIRGLTTTKTVQAVSNEIAKKIFKDITDTLHPNPNVGDIPTIDQVAQRDAGDVAFYFFNQDRAGWAGTSMFLFLGHDKDFNETITEKAGDTYDLLAMLEAGKSASTSIGGFFDAVSLLWNAISTTAINISGASGVIANAAASAQNFMTAAYGTQTALPQTLASNIFLGTLTKADTLTGSTAADFLHGGGGNDTIGYSSGSDVLDGGTGTDTIDYHSRTSALNITIKTLPTKATYVGSINQGTEVDALFNVEKIIAGAGDDSVVIQGIPATTSTLTIDGGAGTHDSLSAFYLTAGVTFDAALGKLTSGAGTINFSNFEKFEGSNFNDTFYVDKKTTSINGRAGVDTVDFSKVTSTPSPISIWGVENIKGSAYADKYNQSDADNTSSSILGGNGNDSILGGGGSDTILGQSGNDTLLGGEGNDSITEDAGFNFLYGGGGNDTITTNVAEAIISDGAGDDLIKIVGDVNTVHEYYALYRVELNGGNDTINIDFPDGADTHGKPPPEAFINLSVHDGADKLIVEGVWIHGNIPRLDGNTSLPAWFSSYGGHNLWIEDWSSVYAEARGVDTVFEVFFGGEAWSISIENFKSGDFGIFLG